MVTYNKFINKKEVLPMAANNKLNLTMLCDFYELTMGNGYFEHGYRDRICYFDVFFPSMPG